MHHVPYTHVLHSGKTVIQHVYDAHYAGAQTAQPTHPSGQTPRPHRRRALRKDPRPLHLPGRPRHRLARRRQPMVPEDIRHPRQARPRRQLPEPHRSRIHARRRVQARRRHALGDRLRWQSRHLHRRPRMHAHHHTRPPRRQLQHRRPVLRPGSGISTYDLLLNGKPIAHWSADAKLPPAVDDPHLDGHTSTRFTVPTSISTPATSSPYAEPPTARSQLR